MNKDVRIKEYQMYPHGFWSFDLPVSGVKDCKKTVKQAAECFKEFIDMD